MRLCTFGKKVDHFFIFDLHEKNVPFYVFGSFNIGCRCPEKHYGVNGIYIISFTKVI